MSATTGIPGTVTGAARKSMSREWDEERREESEKPKEYCQTYPKREDFLWTEVREYLKFRGLSFETAVYNGWYPSRQAGDNLHRLVIPATATGNNKYWQARIMLKEVPSDIRRWQSPPNSRGNALVTVWPVEGNMSTAAVVVEGPLDALAAAEAGFLGISLMGVAPPAEALELLGKIVVDLPIIVAWDADQPEPWIEVLKQLWRHATRGVQLVDVYPKKDLAEVALDKRIALLREKM